MSILVSTGPTTVTKTWYVDGTASDVGTVTIGIDDADGNEIVAAGTAVTDNGDGTYEYALAVQNAPKILTITWTVGSQSQTDILEIVGGWLFTEAELRAFHAGDIAAADFTDAQVNEARDAIAVEFESICGVSFVPRYRREVLAGSGETGLWVDRPMLGSVLACTISGTTVTASNFTVDSLLPLVLRTNGTFSTPSSSSPRNVTISYTHGHTVVPPDIKRAALILARSRLVSDVTGTGVPANASSWTDSSGTFTSFAPSAKTDRWYGMPNVDIPLQRHSLNVPVS